MNDSPGMARPPSTIACLHGICGHDDCFRRVERQTGAAVPLTLRDVATIPQPSESQSGAAIALTHEQIFRPFAEIG